MKLHSIATSLPKYGYSTRELLAVFEGRLSARLEESIKGMGIERRYCVVSNLLEVMSDGLPQTYNFTTTGLASQAVAACLEQSVVDPSQIGVLIAVTNTQSFILPGLAPSIISQLRESLPPTIAPINLQGLGCSAFLSALEVASWYLEGHPDKFALVVDAEAHSPYFPLLQEERYHSFHEIKNQKIKRSGWTAAQQKVQIEHTAELMQSFLFGDGAVALLLGAGDDLSFQPICHLTNLERKDVNLLGITTGGTQQPIVNGKPHAHLGRLIPQRGALYAKRTLETVLSDPNAPISSIEEAAFCFIHTGSRKILNGVCDQLHIATDSPKVATSYQVLRDYGNLSSASIGFMMAKHPYEKGEESQQYGVIVAFGAGFSGGASVVTFNGATMSLGTAAEKKDPV